MEKKEINFNITVLLLVVMSLFLLVFISQIYVVLLSHYLKYFYGFYQPD